MLLPLQGRHHAPWRAEPEARAGGEQECREKQAGLQDDHHTACCAI